MTNEDTTGKELVLYRQREAALAEMKDSRIRKNISFGLGAGLVVLGVIDGAWNPFAFVTAPTLLASGLALMGVGTAKPRAKNAD